MRRLHVPRSQIEGNRALLLPEDRHYLCDVLRLGPGTAIEVFDGDGGTYAAVLSPSCDALELGGRRQVESGTRPIWLAFALSKGEKNDLVVQKGTELGASRFLPWSAERSIVRLDEERAIQRAQRWRRIATEAARQCGRADVPEVMEPLPLAAVLAGTPSELSRIAFYERGGEPIQQLLRGSPAG